MKFACPNCAANIEYDFQNKECYCEHCGSTIDMSSIKTKEYEELPHVKPDSLIQEMVEYECSSCGAKMIVSANATFTKCNYCKSTELLKIPINPDWVPDKILPFRISKEEAKKLFDKSYQTQETISEYIKKSISDGTAQIEINQTFIPCYMTNYDINYHWNKDIYYNQTNAVMFQYINQDFDFQLNQIKNIEIENIKPFHPIFLEGNSVLDAWDKVDLLNTTSEIEKILSACSLPIYEQSNATTESLRISYEKNILKILIPIFLFSIKVENLNLNLNYIIDGSKEIDEYEKNYISNTEKRKRSYTLSLESFYFHYEGNSKIFTVIRNVEQIFLFVISLLAVLFDSPGLTLTAENHLTFSLIFCVVVIFILLVLRLLLLLYDPKKKKILKRYNTHFEKINNPMQIRYYNQKLAILNKNKIEIDTKKYNITEKGFKISEGNNKYEIFDGKIYKLKS